MYFIYLFGLLAIVLSIKNEISNKSALAHWGEVLSEPKEEVFDDPLDPDGTNRTGIYLMKFCAITV